MSASLLAAGTGFVRPDIDWHALAPELVLLANDRCAQEQLIDQLKNGVYAMRMPVGTLVSNWAYMVMASLAWTLKAWFALPPAALRLARAAQGPVGGLGPHPVGAAEKGVGRGQGGRIMQEPPQPQTAQMKSC